MKEYLREFTFLRVHSKMRSPEAKDLLVDSVTDYAQVWVQAQLEARY